MTDRSCSGDRSVTSSEASMMRLPWRSGPARAERSVLVSATRFTYRRAWHLPLVFWHGLRLRSGWDRVEGAVGVSIQADAATRTTYTVSVWQDEESLRRWLVSEHHARLMRDFRGRLASSASATWRTERFDLR